MTIPPQGVQQMRQNTTVITILYACNDHQSNMTGPNRVTGRCHVAYVRQWNQRNPHSLTRVQQLCERRGGRPGFSVPNSPYDLCGRKATLDDEQPDRA